MHIDFKLKCSFQINKMYFMKTDSNTNYLIIQKAKHSHLIFLTPLEYVYLKVPLLMMITKDDYY